MVTLVDPHLSEQSVDHQQTVSQVQKEVTRPTVRLNAISLKKIKTI